MFRSLSLALLATTALVPAAAFAQELPTGGEVQAGAVAIQTTAPGALRITQGSDRAIVNWRSFSVGEGGRVDIDQPNATSALLNRVTGDTTSVIAGQINANGRVYLVNPNGILITRTGSVNAAAFTASTLDIADADFMAGSDVTVTGTRLAEPIRYLEGGFAGALSDDGKTRFVIARVRAVPGSADRALDLGGDGFLQVAVKPGTIEVAGRVTADQIVLTTSAARAAARGVVNVSGVLDASSVSATGGTITLTGDSVNLTAATLDASGALGGGRVRVGLATGAGPARGEGAPTRAAEFVSVDATTRIAADATGSGNGGDVVVWSDAGTSFAGAITARGVAGGVGGNAEVSGKALLDFTGTADLTGAKFGTLLLDPYNVTISNAAQTTGGGFDANANSSVINATTLNNALATANVTVTTGAGGTQNGDITVAAPIAWSSGSLLTLSAAGKISINKSIDITGGGQLTLNFATTDPLSGGLSYGPGAKVTFASGQTGQALMLNGVSYSLVYSIAQLHTLDQTAGAGFYGNLALANDLDLAGTTFTQSILPVSSSFEGLGHVVRNLTIDTTGSTNNDHFGFIGSASGTIRGLSLLGGSVTTQSALGTGALIGQGNSSAVYGVSSTVNVTGAGNVGGLVGASGGIIASSYATGMVSGSGPTTGGLIGNLSGTGTILQSYATGAVSSSGTYAGGLVGRLAVVRLSPSNGVSQSYATGSVTGLSSTTTAGGLVGAYTYGNNAPLNVFVVNQSYATGAVSGPGTLGGLIGAGSTTPVSSYWDTQTSGRATSAGGTGLTTAQLQSGTLPTGFDTAAWVAAPGFYPQLLGFYVGGPQVVSGIASLLGGGVAQNASIALYYNGSLLGGNPVTTDTNGVYRALVPADTLDGTLAFGQTITLSGAGAISGLAYADNYIPSAGNYTSLRIIDGLVTINAGATTASALDAAITATFGPSKSGIYQALASKPVNLTARNGFTIDQAESHGGSFTLTTPGSVAINAALTAVGAIRVVRSANYDPAVANTISIGAGGSVTSYAGGDAILLAAGDTFANDGGAAALSTPNGRWLVYQGSGLAGTRGGLTGGNFYGNGYDFTSGSFTSAPASGNRFVYAAQPVLTLTANSTSSVYTGAAQTGTYTLSGLINGDAAADAVAGTATGLITSSKDVGTYTLTPTGLTSLIGYGFDLRSGTFAITPASLVYTANPLSRAYGDANPAPTGTVTGFVGGDTPANSTSGTLAFATAATPTTGVGSYAVNGSGLTATNYVFAQAPGNATALTITARPITVTADAASRVYGDANPAFSYQVGGRGLVGTDVLSGALTTGAGVTSNVGAFAITQGTLTGGANYAISYTSANLSVTARPLTIAADAKTRVYGDANPALTYTLGGRGLVNGDALTGAPTTAATTTTGVGAYAITQGSLAASANYAVTYNAANLSITARPITVTADAQSRVYGDFNPVLTYQVGGRGLVNGDTLAGVLATTATTTSSVGSYAITQGSLAASPNYQLSFTGNQLAVTVRPITVAADALSRVYGDANPALTYAVGGRGLVNGDTLTGALTTAAGVTSNVGQYAIAQGTLAATTNYQLTYLGANLTVTTRAITVAADALARVYGDTNPALTYTTGGRGLVNGDMLTGALTTAATTTSGVGQYAIAQGSLAASTNYALTFNAANLSVTARPIGVVADAQSRVYGDANPALTYQVGGRGLVNGDTLGGALATGASGTSGVGAYAITQGSLAAGANYALTYTGANLTVTARPISVTADALSRIYGDANPALTYQVGGRGLVNNDMLGGALATTATTMSNVGAYAITQGSLTAGANYALTFTGASLAVTPATLTYTADAKSRVYGDANPALTGTVTGFRNADTQATGTTGALSFATMAGTSAGVGSYAVNGSGLSATNYIFVQAAGNATALSIAARPITVAANAQSRVYGDANPALTYQIGGRGLVNGDLLSGGLATGAVATSGVGAYAIVQGTLTAGANYALTYTGANLTTTARPISVTADALSRVYGDANPAFTYVVGGGGLVNSDQLSGAPTTAATTATGVGQYAITQGTLAASANYALTYTGANLTIVARPITVAADPQNRVYGDANPLLTYTVGGRGLVNNDMLAGGLTTGATTTSGVGQYLIAQGSLTAGANYALTYQGANLSVAARPIAITADAQSRVYGDANPALTYTVGGRGLVNGDTLGGAPTTSAAVTSGVGQYGIAQGTLTAGANYALTFIGANLSVTARPITVAADALSRVYGDANPALTYTLGGRGLVNGDMLSGGLATAAGATSGVGPYAIGQGTLTAGANYALTYQGATLSVTARPITVAADAQSRVYGDANPALTYAVGGRGLVNGDQLSGALATGAVATTGVGQYAITQGSLAAGANYALTYTGATLGVTARPIAVAANALSRLYGDANPALTYILGGRGLANGDVLSGSLATAATAASNVGQYAIGQGTLSAGVNYALTYSGAALAVTPATLTYTADVRTRVYGDADPALTGTVTGFRNADTQATGTTGTLAFSATATTASPVGSYAVTGGGLTATNYQFVQAAGNASALTIAARPIGVIADALTRVYGDANPALTYTLGGRGLVNGDTLTGALTTDAGAASNVGQYAIAQGTLAATANYLLTYTGANLSVTARPITVAADAQSRVYGDANPALTYTVGGRGLVNGDTLGGALTTSAGAASGVGQYAIAQGSLAAGGNYLLTYTGASLTVSARPISVTADTLARLYGDANPALTYTVGGRGLVNGDALAGGLATAATQGSGVGRYAITQGTLSAGGNYALAFVGGTLAITPATLVYAADATSRVYGDANPVLTGAVTGFRNNDTLSGSTTGTLAFTSPAAAVSAVGRYAINGGGLSAANYVFVQAGANATALTVVVRPITVAADALSRVYGDANPALTYTIAGRGLVNGDALSGALATGAGATSGVGAYAIAQGTLAASGNYALTYVGADLTVTARPITVAADALARVYGDANPALTYTLGGRGLVNGDTLTGALSTGAGATSAVGQYAIAQGTLAAGGNYALTFQGANLTVTARPLTITADAQTRVYGDTNPALTYRLGGRGLVNGDALSGALATSATTTSGAGQYAIGQGTLAATANYAVTYAGATLTVTARPLTIMADALSRIYGDGNPALTYTLGGRGLVNGDVLTGALATAATPASDPGRYAIVQGSLAAGVNYSVSYTGNILTITPKLTGLSARIDGAAAAGNVARDHGFLFAISTFGADVAPPALRFCPSEGACVPAGG